MGTTSETMKRKKAEGAGSCYIDSPGNLIGVVRTPLQPGHLIEEKKQGRLKGKRAGPASYRKFSDTYKQATSIVLKGQLAQ